MIVLPKKLPVEVWNIGVDFTAQLNPGETITDGFATVLSGNVTATFIAVNDGVLGVKIAGGDAGSRAIVEVGVNTSAAETLAEALQVIINT